MWLVAAALVHAQAADHSGGVDPSTTTGVTSLQEADVTPSTETQSEYFEVVRKAIAEYEAGRFAEARALFLRAHELWQSARTWRTLGMTAFELSMYPKAQTELQRALDDPRRALGDEQRSQVRALLEQTRAFVGRYHVHLTPPDAVLRLDGAPVTLTDDGSLLLGVGRHELQAEAPGFSELRVEVVVQGREDEPLELKLDAAARTEDLRVATAASLDTQPRVTPSSDLHTERAVLMRRRATAQWLVIGSAAVALSVGVSLLAVGLRAHASASSPEDGSLSYAQWQNERDKYRRLVGWGGALACVSVVVLASGVWWKLTSRGASATQLATDGRSLFLRARF